MIPDYREAPVTRCSGSTISAMQCTAQLLPAPSQPLHKGLTRSTPEFLSDSDAAALAQHSPARSVVMPRRQRPPLYADCTLLPAKEGSSPIRADTLWAERPVCFLLIRRPGCVICRAEARRLEGLRARIEAKGVRLYCLVHEMLPGEIKAFKHFWPGEVYLDADKAFYREVGRGKVHRMNCFGFLWHFRSSAKARVRALETLPDDRSEQVRGTHFVMGGLLIVKARTGETVYRFSEKTFGDVAPADQILAQCDNAAGGLLAPIRSFAKSITMKTGS